MDQIAQAAFGADPLTTLRSEPAPRQHPAQVAPGAMPPESRGFGATLPSGGEVDSGAQGVGYRGAVSPYPSAAPEAFGAGAAVDAAAGPAPRVYNDLPLETTDSRLLPPIAPQRRLGLRWIVALIFLGISVLLVGTVGRDYFDRFVHRVTPSAPAADERVATLLERGQRLLNQGDFEAAKAEFDKASVLAENDPAVLASLASVEAARADLYWLKLRMLAEDAGDVRAETEALLSERLQKLTKVLAGAATIDPAPTPLLATRVDHLRLAGRVAEARAIVGPLTGEASQPEIAYVLAALDLAEENPSYGSAIERLKTAARAELAPGRASAALILALGRSGRTAAAKQALDDLEARDKPHPLARQLAAFVSRLDGESDETGEDTEATEQGDAPELAAGSGGGSAAAPGSQGDGPEGPGDFRRDLEQASRAKQTGDSARAELLYNKVLASQPGNVEALSGLGDIARQRGDHTTARRYYDSVLGRNPTYLPAMMGSADMQWASGNRSGAAAIYRRVVERVGASSYYGARAQQRLDELGSSAQPTPEQPTPAEPSAPETHSDMPEIDTTDLPEFSR